MIMGGRESQKKAATFFVALQWFFHMRCFPIGIFAEAQPLVRQATWHFGQTWKCQLIPFPNHLAARNKHQR